MVSSNWQTLHIHFQSIVWGISAVISTLLIILLLSLGFSLEVAGVFFILVFVIMRVSLAYLLKNRFGNSMVRLLKFDYEEIERDFRIVFKNKFIRFYQKFEEDAYRYEFPGHKLTMNVEPYWQSYENEQSITKITLHKINPKNKEFAEMLAASIDEMADQRASKLEKA